MLPVPDWTDRRFPTGLPISIAPYVIERLRGTPARLADRVRDLPRSHLTRRDGELWSIQEHAGHLLDLEALHLARLDDYDRGVDTLTAADMTNRATFDADHNAKDIADILAGLGAIRGGLVARLEAMTESELARSALHPRLQVQMSLLDSAHFFAEHDDHHLAQITDILARC